MNPPPAELARTYRFHRVKRCIMCNTPAADARVMGLRLDTSQGWNPRGKRGIAVSVCHCRSCGLIFADPQPLPASLDQHYGIPPESYWSDVRDEPPPGYFSRQIAAVKAILGPPPLHALDIGVGLGMATRVMSAAGFETSGIEPSPPFRDHAIRRLGLDPERIRLAPVEEAEFPAASFDFITFGAVLEHLHDPAFAIERALGWLKPGGLIHAEVPNSRHLMGRIINAWFRLIGSGAVTNLSPMHVPFHLFEFSLESFHAHGRRAGYRVRETWVDVASIRHVPGFMKPFLHHIMERQGTGMQLTVFLERL